MEAIVSKLVPLAVEYVVAPLLALLGAWALKRLKDLIDAKVKNESAAGVLHRLTEYSAHVVADMYQRQVEAAKAAAADGKLTAEDAARFRAEAVAAVKDRLGPAGLRELADALGGQAGEKLDDAVASSNEAAIAERRAVARLAAMR